MPVCPECKGKGWYEIQVSEYWEEPIRYETHTCPECIGKRKISKLRLAIYKARGGTAPLQMTILLVILLTTSAHSADYIDIDIFPKKVGVFLQNRTQQFTAFGTLPNGNKEDITRSVDWVSSNKSWVSIDDKGLATIVVGITYGQVTISCSWPKAPPPPPKPITVEQYQHLPLVYYTLMSEDSTEEKFEFYMSLPEPFESWFWRPIDMQPMYLLLLEEKTIVLDTWLEMRGLR